MEYRQDLDLEPDRLLVIGSGAPGRLLELSHPEYHEDAPQQDSGWDPDARRIRYGNNRYHVPRAHAKAKRKARKQAQKAARRR